MIAEEIIATLQENTLTAGEIAKSLGIGPGAIHVYLRDARAAGEIDIKDGRYFIPKAETDDTQPTMEEKITDILKASECRLAKSQIVDALGGGKQMETAVHVVLNALVRDKQATKDGAGFYQLTSHPKPHPVAKRLREKKCGRHAVKTEAKPQPASNKEEKPEALAAIDRLAERIQSRPVQDLDIKVQVLRRLSPLLDSSVSRVLESIAEDLEGL